MSINVRRNIQGISRLTRRYLNDLRGLQQWQNGLGLHPLQYRQLEHVLVGLPPQVQVVEFGSGASTGAVAQMLTRLGKEYSLVSYDHSKQWSYSSTSDDIDVRVRQLVAWTDDGFEKLFVDGYELDNSSPLTSAEAESFRTRNAFYKVDPEDLPHRVDLALIDGPNGNGRSAAFPLLKSSMRAGSLVLIDDLEAYEFERRLSSLFVYETVAKLTDPAIHPTFSFGLFRIEAIK